MTRGLAGLMVRSAVGAGSAVGVLTALMLLIALIAAGGCDPKPSAGEGAAAPQTATNAASSATSGSAAPAPSSSAAGPSCQELAAGARKDVLKRIDDSRSCTSDSECVQVGVGARCFDVCTRAISASQKSAVESALADADAKCKDFVTAGCKLTPPPCLPPPDPKCRDGKCSL